jgi:Domain of unknown function (DUF4386)
MSQETNVGRWVGWAMFGCFFLELVSTFRLQDELFSGGGFLANAATHPLDVGLIIVMGLLSGALSVWVAATLCGRYGALFPSLAWTYFALVVATLAAAVIELATFVAMRNLSELYVAAGPDPGTRFETARAVVRGLRNGMHFSGKLLGGAGVLAFFVLLFKARIAPSWISVFGALAAVSQMVSVALPLFGGDVVYPMLAPLGLASAATFVWLIVKGLPLSGAARSSAGE